ncbi:MAG TPA: HAD family hydrolase [Terriglobia bacterium]
MISSLKPVSFFSPPPSFSSPRVRQRRPAIFFDRDGVINQRIVGGYVTSWSEFRFLDGMIPVLRDLSRLKLPIIVVSNQAGVGKGLMSRFALGAITERFVSELARRGARMDAVYYCPHAPEQACPCRKPQPGLLLRAARDWRIDLSRSVLVGDSLRDIEAASAVDCRGILFDPNREFSAIDITGRDRSGEPGAHVAPTAVVRRAADLYGQVKAILGRSGRSGF